MDRDMIMKGPMYVPSGWPPLLPKRGLPNVLIVFAYITFPVF